jgi:hypothetical protein
MLQSLAEATEGQFVVLGVAGMMLVFAVSMLKRYVRIAIALGIPLLTGSNTLESLGLLQDLTEAERIEFIFSMLAPAISGLAAGLATAYVFQARSERRAPAFLIIILIAGLLTTAYPMFFGDNVEQMAALAPKIALTAFAAFALGFFIVALIRAVIATLPVLAWGLVTIIALLLVHPKAKEYLPNRQYYEKYLTIIQIPIHKQTQKIKTTLAKAQSLSGSNSSEG